MKKNDDKKNHIIFTDETLRHYYINDETLFTSTVFILCWWCVSLLFFSVSCVSFPGGKIKRLDSISTRYLKDTIFYFTIIHIFGTSDVVFGIP